MIIRNGRIDETETIQCFTLTYLVENFCEYHTENLKNILATMTGAVQVCHSLYLTPKNDYPERG